MSFRLLFRFAAAGIPVPYRGDCGLPAHRLLAVPGEVFVGFREVPAAEKAVVGGEGRGVRALEYEVARRVYNRPFALCVTAPQQIDYPLFSLRNGFDDRIGELLPALACMGGGLVCPDGQYGVEQQHPLFRPAVEVAAGRYRCAGVGIYFGEDVPQRRWKRDLPFVAAV